MIKLALCKVYMCGEKALVLGVGRQFMEGDWYWYKFQLYTFEDYVGDPNELCGILQSKEAMNVYFEDWKKVGEKLTDYHGISVLFKSINKEVSVLKLSHDFNFNDCEQVDITLDELNLLKEEIREGSWQDFDEETWAK